MERARQLIGQWVTKMMRVTSDGELIPAYIKTSGDEYQSVDQVDTEDLLKKQKRSQRTRLCNHPSTLFLMLTNDRTMS